jgi:hypothetical protein
MSTIKMIGVIVIAAITTILPPATRADQPVLDVRLVARSTSVMIGEPILLDYEVNNRTQLNTYQVEISARQYDWIRFELKHARGQVVAQSPDYRPSLPISVTASKVLPPGESLKGTFVVSQWLNPREPGHYTLRAYVNLPYHTDESTRSLTHSQSIELPVLVTPPDETRLYAIAEGLGKIITSGSGGIEARDQALQALFAMPDTIAAPVWRSVTKHPRLGTTGRAHVVQELMRRGSRGAVDLLAEMWGDKLSPQRDVSARNALAHLYAVAEPSLRSYIGSLFSKREGKLPATPRQRNAPQIHIGGG